MAHTTNGLANEAISFWQLLLQTTSLIHSTTHFKENLVQTHKAGKLPVRFSYSILTLSMRRRKKNVRTNEMKAIHEYKHCLCLISDALHDLLLCLLFSVGRRCSINVPLNQTTNYCTILSVWVAVIVYLPVKTKVINSYKHIGARAEIVFLHCKRV